MTAQALLKAYSSLATCYVGLPTLKTSTVDKLETLTEHLIADVDSNSISQYEAVNILGLAQHCCIAQVILLVSDSVSKFQVLVLGSTESCRDSECNVPDIYHEVLLSITKYYEVLLVTTLVTLAITTY